MKLGHAVLSRGRQTAPAALLVMAGNAFAAIQSRYNLPPPATKLAEDIYSLHDFMLIICGAIFVLVFGVMFYSIWKHRKSKGAVAANWHENTMVEIVWTVIFHHYFAAACRQRSWREGHIKPTDGQGDRLPLQWGRLHLRRRRGLDFSHGRNASRAPSSMNQYAELLERIPSPSRAGQRKVRIIPPQRR